MENIGVSDEDRKDLLGLWRKKYNLAILTKKVEKEKVKKKLWKMDSFLNTKVGDLFERNPKLKKYRWLYDTSAISNIAYLPEVEKKTVSTLPPKEKANEKDTNTLNIDFGKIGADVIPSIQMKPSPKIYTGNLDTGTGVQEYVPKEMSSAEQAEYKKTLLRSKTTYKKMKKDYGFKIYSYDKGAYKTFKEQKEIFQEEANKPGPIGAYYTAADPEKMAYIMTPSGKSFGKMTLESLNPLGNKNLANLGWASLWQGLKSKDWLVNILGRALILLIECKEVQASR